jgi:hypothetical protein
VKRPVFLATTISACVAAAWLGWQIGRPTANETRAVAPAAVQTLRTPITPANYDAAAGPEFDARDGRDVAEILAAIDRMRLDPQPQGTTTADNISGELFALIYSLQPDEISAVLEHLASLPAPSPDKLLAAVLGRWAEFDGAAAMKYAGQLPRTRLEKVRSAVLAGWARHDPQAAYTWYLGAWETAPEPRYHIERDFPFLIHAWALRDPRAALQACLEMKRDGPFEPWEAFAGLVAIPERRAEILSLIGGLEDEKVRRTAYDAALCKWADVAPAEAAAWLDANLPNADHSLVWDVARMYGVANPRANADWLLRRTPPDKRDEAYGMCLWQWVEKSPDEAAAWLESAGVTEKSAQTMARHYASYDLDRAIAWAQRVSPAGRAKAVAATLGHATRSGLEPDISRYAAAAGVSEAELSGLLEKEMSIERGGLAR